MTRPTQVANVTGDRCPRQTCRARLDVSIERFTGRTIIRCLACERRVAGICRRCARPVAGQKGKALYCEVHKVIARAEQQRACAVRHREVHLERCRLREHRPEVRARRLEQKRVWHAKNRERRNARDRERYRKGKADDAARDQRASAPVRRADSVAHYSTPPSPVCRICGRSIPFPGTGRPRVTCEPRGRCPHAAHHAPTHHTGVFA